MVRPATNGTNYSLYMASASVTKCALSRCVLTICLCMCVVVTFWNLSTLVCRYKNFPFSEMFRAFFRVNKQLLCCRYSTCNIIGWVGLGWVGLDVPGDGQKP